MKKKLLWLSILSGFTASVSAQTFPVANISIKGAATNRINVVVLPDGFQAPQLTLFKTKVQAIQLYLFNQAPFRQYANFFNVYAIEVPSTDTGVIHPGTATDVTEPAYPVTNPTTYFRSTFDNGNVHRAVYAQNSSAIYSVLNDNVPMYDVPLVLVNTTEYGGTGGGYITFTTNTSANETAVHEMGHTFGKLWDEYWNNMPGEHPNMTQTSNPSTIKWKNWIGTGAVGVYPYGTSAPQSTWYRPHQNCKMQFLGVPMCPVCTENIIDRIYEKIRPIDAYLPDTVSTVQSTTAALSFKFSPILPNPSTLKYKWVLNGTVINSTDTAVSITPTQLLVGNNVLTAILTDTTTLSRSNLPANGYMFSITWKIKRDFATTVSTVVSNDKFVYKLYPVPAKNTVSLYCNNVTAATSLNYDIVSITGSVVKKGDVAIAQGEQVLPFDIAGLAPGTYTLNLQGDGILVNTKMIVE